MAICRLIALIRRWLSSLEMSDYPAKTWGRVKFHGPTEAYVEALPPVGKSLKLSGFGVENDNGLTRAGTGCVDCADCRTRRTTGQVMAGVQTIIALTGIALCALALVQMSFWAASSIRLRARDRKQFQSSQQSFREEILRLSQPETQTQNNKSWSGFRSFRVDRLKRESFNTTSVWLVPADGKSIASFQPGQHLTFRFAIPGFGKPVTRCYSLSDRPGQNHYRITVKHVEASRPPAKPVASASQFINQSLSLGDIVDIKAPSGSFCLDESSQRPIVMLAGGIGVTPMISMMEYVIAGNQQRMMLLVFGVRHGSDHPFADRLRKLSDSHDSISVVNCYSKPRQDDVRGVDYQVAGFASVEILKHVLPTPDCDYYLCGPPAFMESLYEQLQDWEIPADRIRLEAFGPASIRKTASKDNEQVNDDVEMTPVKFAASDRTVIWEPEMNSLLDLATANDVEIETGCLAGNCQTCQTKVIAGEVSYPDGEPEACDAGHCLPCIARPDGPLELEV